MRWHSLINYSHDIKEWMRQKIGQYHLKSIYHLFIVVKVETARVKWPLSINYIFVGNQRTRRVSMMRLKKDMMPWQYPKVNKRILHIYIYIILIAFN